MTNPFNTLKSLNNDNTRFYYSLPELGKHANIKRLPVSIRIMLESLLRNCDGHRVKEEDVLRLAGWNPQHPDSSDVPFVVSRVILQDFTGVPLLVDLAAMRDAVAAQGLNADTIEPQVPVDLVIDHSVQVDMSGSDEAFLFNLKVEFQRNRERYEFLLSFLGIARKVFLCQKQYSLARVFAQDILTKLQIGLAMQFSTLYSYKIKMLEQE
jgi:aconitate hydratase